MYIYILLNNLMALMVSHKAVMDKGKDGDTADKASDKD